MYSAYIYHLNVALNYFLTSIGDLSSGGGIYRKASILHYAGLLDASAKPRGALS